jgi:hypothetical protein
MLGQSIIVSLISLRERFHLPQRRPRPGDLGGHRAPDLHRPLPPPSTPATAKGAHRKSGWVPRTTAADQLQRRALVMGDDGSGTQTTVSSPPVIGVLPRWLVMAGAVWPSSGLQGARDGRSLRSATGSTTGGRSAHGDRGGQQAQIARPACSAGPGARSARWCALARQSSSGSSWRGWAATGCF